MHQAVAGVVVTAGGKKRETADTERHLEIDWPLQVEKHGKRETW